VESVDRADTRPENGDVEARVRFEQTVHRIVEPLRRYLARRTDPATADDVHGYLVPSGYVVGSEHRRDLYYAARALDNTMYVVFANNVGGDKPWSFNGGAAIYDPEGRCLARGDNDSEIVIVSTLDSDVVDETRAAHSMLHDRLANQGGARRQLTV